MNQFSGYIRTLRNQRKILQHEVAVHLKAITIFVGKLGNGERQVCREQVHLFAELFSVDKDKLLSLWLGEKVYDLVKDEDIAL